MDIQHLVDRLEELIDEGRHVPFSKFTLIDEERALEIIDQMRISIPEEIAKAARVLAQRDHVLAQANQEAARLVQLAREKGDQLVDREPMVQAAQSRAVNIVEAARQEADGVIDEADSYVLDQLTTLEQRLTRMMAEVRAGIQHVNTNGAANADPAPQAVAQSSFAPPAPRPTVDVTVRQTQDAKSSSAS